jgi:4-hydroxybenzoate polyprenyltransferase
VFISCLGALVGALNSAVYLNLNISLFQIIMILPRSAFLSAGLMIHNDVRDLKSDELNRPHKPLPSGVIKTRTAFAISLILTWILTYQVVLQNDEKKTWAAFERYERTGTRAMVIVFQLILLLEVFY